MRAVGSIVIIILGIIVVVAMAMGGFPVVTMAVRTTAGRAVLILRVVDDDLGRTVLCCC